MVFKLVTGNEAIAEGAIESGVRAVTGYPGAPVSGIVSTLAEKTSGQDVYVEWSANERVALEVAAGASFSGERAMCVMKHVGMNVASDPLNVLNLTGVVGGLVIIVGSDPVPSSSQNSMDPRHYAMLANVPYFEPSSPAEAKEMVKYAFRFSEEQGLPVILGVTSRISYAMSNVSVSSERRQNKSPWFDRQGHKFVCLPFTVPEKVKALNKKMRDVAKNSASPFDWEIGEGSLTIIGPGFAYNHVMEALEKYGFSARVLKIGRIHPLPEKLLEKVLKDSEKVLVVEERDPIVEKEVIVLKSKLGLDTPVLGTMTEHVPREGVVNTWIVGNALGMIKGRQVPEPKKGQDVLPRPGALCAGCPHRSSYYLIRKALEKYPDHVIVGDRGCYNRAAAPPENLLDVCMSMGSDVGIAQGISIASPGQKVVSVMGDSTFFHSGITALLNAAANYANVTVFVLDNSYTSMTGQQPNPGTGMTARGDPVKRIEIYPLLKSRGHARVYQVDPYDVKNAYRVIEKAVEGQGLSIVVMKRECALKAEKPKGVKTVVDPEKCTGCRTCIRETGCPALVYEKGKVSIDQSKCFSCGLCQNTCPFQAIGEEHEL